MCPGTTICQIKVTQYLGANYSKYSLLNNRATKESLELLPSTPLTDIVAMNEYRFLFINVTALRKTAFSNATTFTIRKTDINGASFMLISTKISQPTFSELYE
jgi:hypothetical protein